MAAWGYGLLGPVEVRVDGRAVPLPGARQRLVLTMLLVDFNRMVPAGRLIDELWEAALPGDPRGALRTQVSRLRRALGPAGGDLATVEGGYCLAVQRGQLDATRFEDMLAKAARADRSLHDQDLIAALSVLAQSYERRVNSGLHYEQPLTSDARRRVASEIETMVKEYREAEQKHAGYSSLRDSEVLKALVFLLRLANGRTSGRPKARAFVEFLFTQFPEKEAAVVAPQEAGSRIILP